jgi:hypothetical protein
MPIFFFCRSITATMYLFVLGQISGPRRWRTVWRLFQVGSLGNSLKTQRSGEGGLQARKERNISTVPLCYSASYLQCGPSLVRRRSWPSFFMSTRACDIWQVRVHRDLSCECWTWLCHLVAVSLRMCRRSALLGVTTLLSHCQPQCDNDTGYFAKRMVRIESGISGVLTSVPFHSTQCLYLIGPPNRYEIAPPH